jgi:hypothetical protein
MKTESLVGSISHSRTTARQKLTTARHRTPRLKTTIHSDSAWRTNTMRFWLMAAAPAAPAAAPGPFPSTSSSSAAPTCAPRSTRPRTGAGAATACRSRRPGAARPTRTAAASTTRATPRPAAARPAPPGARGLRSPGIMRIRLWGQRLDSSLSFPPDARLLRSRFNGSPSSDSARRAREAADVGAEHGDPVQIGVGNVVPGHCVVAATVDRVPPLPRKGRAREKDGVLLEQRVEHLAGNYVLLEAVQVVRVVLERSGGHRMVDEVGARADLRLLLCATTSDRDSLCVCARRKAAGWGRLVPDEYTSPYKSSYKKFAVVRGSTSN